MNMKKRLSLCWRILRAKSCNSMKHANRELPHIGNDEMGSLMADQLRELVLVFSTHGHSGFSANYAIRTLGLLLRFKPIAALTGEDNEWVEIGEGVKQNNRCSSVFIDADRFNGKPYDINAIVFREPSGACFTGRGSGQPISFPYNPPETPIYIDVDPESGMPLNGWNRDGVYSEWLARHEPVSIKERSNG